MWGTVGQDGPDILVTRKGLTEISCHEDVKEQAMEAFWRRQFQVEEIARSTALR